MQYSTSKCFSRQTQSLFLLLLVLASLANYGTTVSIDRSSRVCNNATFMCNDNGGGVINTPRWFFNGTMQHRCITDAIKDRNELRVIVSPDCEGFLQCAALQSGSALSEPIVVHGK